MFYALIGWTSVLDPVHHWPNSQKAPSESADKMPFHKQNHG